MVDYFVTLIVVAIVSYALVDALRLLIREDFWYPLVALLFSVYNAIRLHASIYAMSGVKFYGSKLEAYIISGIIASLGAKEIYNRFGDFVKPKNESNDKKDPNRVLGG